MNRLILAMCIGGLVGCINSGCGFFSGSRSDAEAILPDDSKLFTATASGLKYRIQRSSSIRRPALSDTVSVHYRGWLEDGQEFGSSYESSQPVTLRLDQAIPAWQEGLQLIGEGGVIELQVPASLARPAPGEKLEFPQGQPLNFLVELIKVGSG